MKIIDIASVKGTTQDSGNNRMITLSIIVPVYNEQDMLPLFHHELLKELLRLNEQHIEIIYINDGSTDASWQIINQLTVFNGQILGLNLSRNFGKEAALTAGLDHARGNCVVIMDADLQDPPSLLGQMLDAWRQGADVVNMKRGQRYGESLFKVLSANAYYWLLEQLSDVPIERNVGDFRLLSRRVVDHIKQLPERNRYMKGIMSWPGFCQKTLYFDRPPRAAGQTKWSFVQLVKLGVSGITAFSVRPLKLASWIGAFISLAAFFYGLSIMLKTLLYGEPVAGFPTMVLIQLFLGGLQLLTIGILGEYVGRIFIETKGRPVYLLMEQKRIKQLALEDKQHG